MIVAFCLACAVHATADSATVPVPQIYGETATVRLEGQDPKPQKRAFPKLKSTAKKRVDEGLQSFRTAKSAATAKEHAQSVTKEGAGAVPKVMDYYRRLEDPERVAMLDEVLNQILKDEDLDLAAKELNKKAAPTIRSYLARRFADSQREDAKKVLQGWIEDTDQEVRYQAARGLLWKQDIGALGVVHSYIQSQWTKHRVRIRADFQGIQREPLSGATMKLMQTGGPKERLAGVRLFELVGSKIHSKALKEPLENSDGAIKHAAINACRVVIDGAPPLKSPSVFEDIKHAQEWLKKL